MELIAFQHAPLGPRGEGSSAAAPGAFGEQEVEAFAASPGVACGDRQFGLELGVGELLDGFPSAGQRPARARVVLPFCHGQTVCGRAGARKRTQTDQSRPIGR